jgi:small subunit ribosomal protein S20
MPHNLSATKRLRQNATRNLRNRSAKHEIKNRSKRLLEAVEEKDLDRAKQLLLLVTSKIDKAKKKNILHANKAARLQSRLARIVNSLAQASS